MAFDIKLGIVSKKRNSTKIATEQEMTKTVSVVLKENCSDYNPVFLLNFPENVFPYNYVQWDNWYYFIDDVIRGRNNLFEVHCTQDVLATYKSYILQTTAFVAYSSVSGGAWLPDKRVPVKADCIVSRSTANLGIWREGGIYILTVIGETGACSFGININGLYNLIRGLQNDQTDIYDDIMDLVADADYPSIVADLQQHVMGNDFTNAPQCIRSCTWIPFNITGASSEFIYLGKFKSTVAGIPVNGEPITGSITVSIPWHYSDWRRAYCEDIYLYLPLVGIVSLSSDSLTNAGSITIYYSYTVTDGKISYQVVSGGEIIGAYGGSCAADYPIGINQKASANEVMNSIMEGVGKTVSTLTLGSAPSVASGVNAVITGIKTAEVALSHHPSCVGGVGGGAGSGLPRDVVCYSVAHSTALEPSELAGVLGVPTQKVISLSSCTGYCECINAHCAIPASSDAINAVDMFLNSGFYIE